LLKLNKEIDMEVMKYDKDKFFNNPDKSKGDRYQAWFKSIKSDLYIDQTAKILSDMVAAQVQSSASAK